MSKKKVIIDCDPGTDDSQAILMALASSNIDVVAVTTTFGNNTAENSALNALRTLKVVDRLDVPVYKGCGTALNGFIPDSDGFHGFDGMGDVPHLYQVDPANLQKDHSSSALVNYANRDPGEITLMVTGPMTNLAVALQLDPTLGQKIKECVVMGGNTTGKGNVTKTAEYNFYCDPEAADKVFKDFKGKIVIVPLEICEENSFSWEWYSRFTSQKTNKGRFVCETDKAFVATLKKLDSQEYMAWDQLCAAVVIDPGIILESKKAKASMELHDQAKRAMMIVDWNSDDCNVTIVTRIDKVKCETEIYKAVCE